MRLRSILILSLLLLQLLLATQATLDDSAADWYKKGNEFSNNSSFELAIKCYDKALKVDPLLKEAWYYKGLALNSLGRYDEAIPIFEKAIEIDPLYADAWALEGDSLNNLGISDPNDYNESLLWKAVYYYQAATEINQSYAAAWASMGRTYTRLEEYDWALYCLDKSLAIDNSSKYAWSSKGDVLREQGLYEDAIECYDKALEIDPYYTSAWIGENQAIRELNINQAPDLTVMAILVLLLLVIFLTMRRRELVDRIKLAIKPRKAAIYQSLPEHRPTISEDITQALKAFQGVKNRALCRVLKFMTEIILLLAIFAIIVGDLMLLPGIIAAAMITFFAPNLLLGYIPETFGSLWDRNIIATKTMIASVDAKPIEEGSSSIASPSDLALLEEAYLKYIREFEEMLNHWGQWAMGVFFALWGWIGIEAFALHFSSPDISDSYYKILSSELAAYHFIAELMTGFVIGLMAWRMLVIGVQVWRLGEKFDLIPQLGHPDRCGGLEPLGNLCLRNAIALFIPGIYLSGWCLLIVATVLGVKYNYEVSEIPAHIILLLVPMLLILISFFLPQWNVHTVMASKRAVIWQQFSQQIQSINSLVQEMLDMQDKLESDESGKMAKQIELMQEVSAYLQNQYYPTWPFSLGILTKLAALLIAVLPLIQFLFELYK